MLLIECPYCGVRDEREFRHGGPAGINRPTSTDSTAWVRYLYWHPNEPGRQLERWLHASGCQRWLEIQRDLTSNIMTGNGG